MSSETEKTSVNGEATEAEISNEGMEAEKTTNGFCRSGDKIRRATTAFLPKSVSFFVLAKCDSCFPFFSAYIFDAPCSLSKPEPERALYIVT